jgi:glutaminase
VIVASLIALGHASASMSAAYVSTGSLPAHHRIQALVAEAHERPGKGGMGTFAPRLDAAGNSVRGQLVARFLSEQLGMDLLISTPAR